MPASESLKSHALIHPGYLKRARLAHSPPADPTRQYAFGKGH